ncbi:MAG TPA: hypothetical protein PLI18_19160, partial [Pirellulaceae bacterium]|nr:hypothetical protein [Pirellulaceae bacterium]
MPDRFWWWCVPPERFRVRRDFVGRPFVRSFAGLAFVFLRLGRAGHGGETPGRQHRLVREFVLFVASSGWPHRRLVLKENVMRKWFAGLAGAGLIAGAVWSTTGLSTATRSVAQERPRRPMGEGETPVEPNGPPSGGQQGPGGFGPGGGFGPQGP